MPKKPRRSTSPRKQPKQARAVATVDAILQAATYILVREGWDAFTTNRVAERAGVNVASLYQYFPNKQSIVVELQRRHIAGAREGMPQAVPILRGQRSMPAMLELVVRAAVDEHRVAPALHRAFADEIPRSARPGDPASDERARAFWVEILEPFVRNVPDLEIAAFVARVAVHAVVHEAASERPELLERPELVTEIVTLLDRYLRRPARAARDQAAGSTSSSVRQRPLRKRTKSSSARRAR